MDCTVELFGIPRQLMKTSQIKLDLPPGARLEEVAAALGHLESRLRGRVIDADTNALVSPYMFYREGRGFVDDLSQRVEPGDHLLLMLAALGG